MVKYKNLFVKLLATIHKATLSPIESVRLGNSSITSPVNNFVIRITSHYYLV